MKSLISLLLFYTEDWFETHLGLWRKAKVMVWDVPKLEDILGSIARLNIS